MSHTHTHSMMMMAMFTSTFSAALLLTSERYHLGLAVLSMRCEEVLIVA